MALTPTGLLSKPLDLVADLVAAVSAFQTWAGHAGDATATKAGHIHLDAVEPVAGVIERPYILVMHGPNARGDSRRGGSGARNHFVHDWEIYFRFCAVVSAVYLDNPRDAFLEFTNNVGAVLAGMELLAGTGGMPNVTDWRSLAQPIRADRDDVGEGDFWIQEYSLTVAEGL